MPGWETLCELSLNDLQVRVTVPFYECLYFIQNNLAGNRVILELLTVYFGKQPATGLLVHAYFQRVLILEQFFKGDVMARTRPEVMILEEAFVL